jgi:pSer/pThr/pTyr-binding forkhead associated (FHA) protein
MNAIAAIQWESLGTVVAAFALAVWALRDPDADRTTSTAVEGQATLVRLRASLPGQPVRTAQLGEGATLGRAPGCDFVLDDPTVSKHHARIRCDAGPQIEDLHSTNGTYVNGRPVDGPTALRRGDRIALGAAKIVFLGLAVRGSKSPKG